MKAKKTSQTKQTTKNKLQVKEGLKANSTIEGKTQSLNGSGSLSRQPEPNKKKDFIQSYSKLLSKLQGLQGNKTQFDKNSGLKTNQSSLNAQSSMTAKFSLSSKNGFSADRLIFNNAGKNKNAKISQKQEKELATMLSGRVHFFSGASFYEKSDLSSELFRVEAKTTHSNDKIAIKTSDITKIEEESINDERIAVLSFKLDNRHFAIVKQHHIDSFREYLEDTTKLVTTSKVKIAKTQTTFNKKNLMAMEPYVKEANEVKYIITLFNDEPYYVFDVLYLAELQNILKSKKSGN